MASYGALVREVGGSWREDSITLQPHQLVNLHAKLIAQSTAQEERDQFLALLKRLEPHLDAIVCYASTMNEHEPNRLAYEVRAAIAKATGSAA